jgi:hypothetical protein
VSGLAFTQRRRDRHDGRGTEPLRPERGCRRRRRPAERGKGGHGGNRPFLPRESGARRPEGPRRSGRRRIRDSNPCLPSRFCLSRFAGNLMS